MLQKRNTPVLRFRNLILKDVLGVLEDWGFDHIKCFTFITQILEGHKISLKIRITGSNGLKAWLKRVTVGARKVTLENSLQYSNLVRNKQTYENETRTKTFFENQRKTPVWSNEIKKLKPPN